MAETRRLRRLGRNHRRGQRLWWCVAAPAAHQGRGREDPRALSRRPPVPLDDRHAADTGSARASTATSSSRIPSRSKRSRRRCTRGCCRSPGTGGRKLGRTTPWPDDLDDWLDMCHEAGQKKSTAILLKYGKGDWNALHRDLYGDLVFPLQVVINLSEPGVDHTGGEFLLVEQRPRAQSRGTSTLLPLRPRLRLHHPRAAGAIGTRAGRRPRSGTVCRPSAPASVTRSASYSTTPA